MAKPGVFGQLYPNCVVQKVDEDKVIPVSALPVDGDTKKKLILLDVLSTLFVDSNIIGTVKYQYSVEHIVKKINDSNICCE